MPPTRRSEADCTAVMMREGVVNLSLAPAKTRDTIAFLEALSLVPLTPGESTGYTFPYDVQVQLTLEGVEDIYRLQTDGTILYTVGGQTFAYKAQNPQALQEYGEGLHYLSKQVFPLASVLPFAMEEVESLEISTLPPGEALTLSGEDAREYASELGQMVLKPYEGENPATGGAMVYTFRLQNGQSFVLQEAYIVTFDNEPLYVNVTFPTVPSMP